MLATGHTVEQIRQIIGADSLGYLSIEHVTAAGHPQQVRVLHRLLHRPISRSPRPPS